MKSRFVISIFVMALVVAYSASTVRAQGFAAILEKIENLEKRLNDLEAAQQRSLQEMKSLLSQLEPASGADSSFATLHSRLENLAADLETVKSSAAGQGADDETVNEMAREVRGLLDEFRSALKELPEQDSEQSGIAELSAELDQLKDVVEERTGLEIVGFFDMVVHNFENNTGHLFHIGDFELDLTKGFLDRFEISTALVFNEDGAEMAVGFIDLNVGGGRVPVRGRIFAEPGFHLQIGRYDLPFGIDYQYFAAPDRENVSAPLTTELVMDGGLGDQGFRMIKSGQQYNSTFYVVNGFLDDGVAVGGRIGFNPLINPYTLHARVAEAKPLEIGFSFYSNRDHDFNSQVNILGVDLESVFDPFHLKGEYVRRTNKVEDVTDWGFYLSGSMSIPESPFYVFLRWGRWENKFDEEFSRTTACVGYNLEDIAILKMEYNFLSDKDFDFDQNKWFAQIAVSF